jgi:extradiol dioxygenase family protein
MSATFHLALPVRDLDEAEAFYVGVLGAGIGRRTPGWLDIWLFGAQVTLHHAPEVLLPLDGQGHRHFGAVLSRADWEQGLKRARAADVHFVSAPLTEHAGEPIEQSKFMLADPSGNHVEFKTYPNEAAALARPPEEAAR